MKTFSLEISKFQPILLIIFFLSQIDLIAYCLNPDYCPNIQTDSNMFIFHLLQFIKCTIRKLLFTISDIFTLKFINKLCN